MGGDFAPQMIVKGAVEASRESGARLLLTGQPERLQEELALFSGTDHKVDILPAETFVPMDASYTEALRRNSSTSIAVGLEAVRCGEAGAFISAGHTGAVVGNAFMNLGKFSGIDRPAIMALYPSLGGPVAVVDAGANVDCKPQHLRDFARMGSFYLEEVLGVQAPTVGLLSIGSEPQKGNKLTLAAWQLLADSGLNFVGNVEGDKVFSGECRVVVCDGFVGNVVLKMCEGFGQFVLTSLERSIASDEAGRRDDNLHRAAKGLQQALDYAEYGGALLLGVNGLCVICHGRSDSRAIVNAVKAAERGLAHRVVEKMRLAAEKWAVVKGTEGAT
jgi:glycerol-3-phosphate acyltransferase PlsX